jgi:hypothetical protein
VNLMVLVMLSIALILLYAAVKNRNPIDLVKGVFKK